MTRNEQPAALATYDDDFFTWTQEQAAALRLTRDVIGGSVDVEHFAEEIEDLGKSELHGVFSFLVLVLQHLMKLHIAPDFRDRRRASSNPQRVGSSLPVCDSRSMFP